MSEKPERRLVSKSQYVRTMGRKWGFYAASALLIASSPLFAYAIFVEIHRHFDGTEHVGWAVKQDFWKGLIFQVVILYYIFKELPRSVYKRGKDIEPVRMSTKANSHLLPPEETLVRASDTPPSQQQAELLRAAPQGSETPPEELLRATANRQDD